VSASIQVTEWTPRSSGGALRGFAGVVTPSGYVFNECGIFEQNGRWWASPSSKPMIGRDGVALKDEKGKVKYAPVVSFTDKNTRNRWSDAVIAALHAAHPELLG